MICSQRPVCGVSTRVGKLCTVSIPAAEAAQLQRNIIRSHAAGVGAPLPEPAVRAMMVLRANTLACASHGTSSRLSDGPRISNRMPKWTVCPKPTG